MLSFNDKNVNLDFWVKENENIDMAISNKMILQK